ncbi:hypothetical protein OIE62_29485 [Streptomyces scopuliridis]|uniref:Uncharacterized protein n=1 Tax=Streptomyces scopuliridis TaxID=452529 RepID=A0ACD4ZGT9_9ACTN|nr:hypothetical protein [Streptomyces scopuliridis]WSB97568.1 hypothetical protein OG835_11450 [Streptomyces scopuliridis]WSC08729.1 hypothetical protein OIE62_29485 [Streptomyces scopuliridis]
MITNGAVDRTVHGWIADEHSRSTVKNSLAVLVRVMEQAVRDGLITINPARVTGWQREYKQAEDELDNPRALALRNWPTLLPLAQALVDHSHDHYRGWGRSSSSPPPPPPASAKSPGEERHAGGHVTSCRDRGGCAFPTKLLNVFDFVWRAIERVRSFPSSCTSVGPW